jgi:hypothetical protein
LKELRNHVNGVSDKERSRLPVNVTDMERSLEALRHSPSQRAVPEPRTSTRPMFCRFNALETLTARQAMPARLGALQASAAQSLGAILQERFDWTRPLKVEQEPFLKLAQELREPQASGSAWSLRVDDEALNVELVLHTHSADRSLGVVLKEGAHLDGVRVFRPNTSDDLETLWSDLGKSYNGVVRTVGRVQVPASLAINPERPLDGVDLEGRVMVLGHGRPGRGRAEPLVAGLTPKQLAAQLIQQGLPKAFKGTVFLHACSSGNGLGRTDGFSSQLQRELAAKGFKSLSVSARPGVADGMLGKADVVPSEVVLHGPATVQRTDRLIRTLQQQKVAATPEDARLYGRLVEQEQAYRARIAGIAQGQLVDKAGIESGAVAPLQREAAVPTPKPPFHRRLLNGIRHLFWRSMPKGQAEVARHDAQAGEQFTFDQARVRGLWGHHGPKDARADKWAKR